MDDSASNFSCSVSSQPSDSKKKKGKGKNFTVVEDQQLCRSWLNVSQDPVMGTGQKVYGSN
ncbi:hypothetical protein BC937DRAFT_93156 [Endogone sp. FLAS-F59071]|nr:hypothetical protein BC937DRAFT_93156 [Endogone sp. FLAS-F59071]|eukprot:RUS14922.1 hypothetical protein BC937DRAFT_93156 [Endogone sp. FLAS-F59071]